MSNRELKREILEFEMECLEESILRHDGEAYDEDGVEIEDEYDYPIGEWQERLSELEEIQETGDFESYEPDMQTIYDFVDNRGGDPYEIADEIGVDYMPDDDQSWDEEDTDDGDYYDKDEYED